MAGPQTAASAYTSRESRVLEPKPEALHEAGGLRIRELRTISLRLGRMGKRQWDRWFAGAAILLLGGVIGGGIGLVPFLSYKPSPSSSSKVLYIVLLVAALLLAAVCGLARLAIRSEREDSCEAIKKDLDTLLGAYEGDEDEKPAPRSTAVPG